jgi:hypothetical protein
MNIENNLCSDYEPMERSGGAIGDLNGDGIFDTVDITTFITKLSSHNLNKFSAHSVLTRFSLNINKADQQIVANYQTDILNKTINEKLLNILKEKNSFLFEFINEKDLYILPKQTWNSYLGRYANSHYYRNII